MSTNINKDTVGDEKIIPTVCAAHCGGSCLLKCHVKDGVLVRVETDDGPETRGEAEDNSRRVQVSIHGATVAAKTTGNRTAEIAS